MIWDIAWLFILYGSAYIGSGFFIKRYVRRKCHLDHLPTKPVGETID